MSKCDCCSMHWIVECDGCGHRVDPRNFLIVALEKLLVNNPHFNQYITGYNDAIYEALEKIEEIPDAGD